MIKLEGKNIHKRRIRIVGFTSFQFGIESSHRHRDCNTESDEGVWLADDPSHGPGSEDWGARHQGFYSHVFRRIYGYEYCTTCPSDSSTRNGISTTNEIKLEVTRVYEYQTIQFPDTILI